MTLLEINWRPSRTELRLFSWLLLLFAPVAAWVVHWRWEATAAAWMVLAAVGVVGACGLFWPELVRPVYVAWLALTFPIGWLVSHLLLAAVFYLVLTPTGLMIRWCGRDPLPRRFDRSAPSYWIRRTPNRDVRRYFRQF